jgi:rubrerythrin
MAELTQLESKLGEVMGLAQAAQESTAKVIKMVDDKEVAALLRRMRQEAAETEKRCKAVASERKGKKSAIQEKAKETKSEAVEMMNTYLGNDADGLDGFEFLTMAEAGELGHVEIVAEMNRKARDAKVKELVQWVTPIQKRHVKDTRTGSLKLAAQEDPNETE